MEPTPNAIQSLDRGLTILRLLADRGTMSSAAIAEELGIHQSSASRLLKSLRAAGLVRKPHFHGFAVGYGLLHIAGIAMKSFPIVPASVKVCTALNKRTGCGAAAGTLWENRITYFARFTVNPDASPFLVDDSAFPVMDSALGRLLLYRRAENDGERGLPFMDGLIAESIRLSLAEYGIFHVESIHTNRFAAAIDFVVDGLASAIIIHSETEYIAPRPAAEILSEAKKDLFSLLHAKGAVLDHRELPFREV